MMVSMSRKRWTSLRRLALAEGSIGSMKPWLGRGNLYTLVCISSPQCILRSGWWCVDTEDDEEETSDYMTAPIDVCCIAVTDFVGEQCSFTIAIVYLDTAGKQVGENNTQLFSWQWPEDDEMLLPIITTIVNTTTLSIVNAVVTGLPDCSLNVTEPWGSRVKGNRNGHLRAHNGTLIFDINTAARWVKVRMNLINPMLFCVVYHSQQADSRAGTLTLMCGGHSYVLLDDIVPPPAEDMTDNIEEELNDDAEMWRPNPTSFPTMKLDF